MRISRNIAGALLLGSVCLATPSFAAFDGRDPDPDGTTWCAENAGALGIPETECLALEALWNDTVGTGWTATAGDETDRLANWGTATSVNDDGVGTDGWLGVTVAGGHVTKIELREKNLDGTLPALVGSNLGSLTRLDVPGNNLTIDLADLVPAAPTLQVLLISHNSSISNFASVADLANLTMLNFGSTDTAVTGNLSEVQNLAGLTRLDLSGNNITGDITALANLNSLETLRLPGNSLVGDIAVFADNIPIQILDLGDNGVTGDINAFRLLTSLKELDLRHNSVSGNLSSLAGLSQLTRLWLGGNQVTGNLSSLSGLTNLITLYIHENAGITGNLSDLSGLTLATSTTGSGDYAGINTALNISGNGLYFSNIEPAFASFDDGSPATFLYDSSQLVNLVDLVDTARTVYFNQTLTITPAVPVNATGNDTYQWSDGGGDIVGATDRVFTKAGAAAGDAGDYTYEVENTVVTELTLRSRTITAEFDDVAPETPATIPDLVSGSDSGNSTDNITNDNTPEFASITCTGQPGGSTLQLYVEGNPTGSPFNCTAADEDAHSLTTATLADGTYSVSYREIDAAGNESADSDSLSITIDTSISLAVTAPGSTTTDTTPQFVGTGDNGDSITVTGNGSSCTATVAANGSWSCDVSPALTNNTIVTFIVTAEDTAGNTSSVSRDVTIGTPQDRDGDGVIDANDAFPDDPNETVDTDGDGIGNNADTDDDNDGFTDEEERAAGTDPLNALSNPDAKPSIVPLIELLLLQ